PTEQLLAMSHARCTTIVAGTHQAHVVGSININTTVFFFIVAAAQRATRFPSTALFRSRMSVVTRGPEGATIYHAMRPEEVEGLRSEEHTSELQSREKLACRLLLEKKKSIPLRHGWRHHSWPVPPYARVGADRQPGANYT